MTTIAPTAPDLESMSFDELQKELKGIPTQQQAAINRADPKGLRAIKGRGAAIKEQLVVLRIANLKAEVERHEASLQAAYATQKVALETSVKVMAEARADTAKATAVLEDAKRRYSGALAQQDAARHTVEACQERLREAGKRQREAMLELAEI